ncbi:hypothetical protein [Enterococcus casseliflavus]|uniref:hypothetical protein n=1 Tax=Enterococcus casseliflavus TaxID=37734 RepID=UPI001F2037EE|nr:hypothetical protein [Enterococcus casseliflavus]
MEAFEKARKFIYKNARPVDLARWQYHFENGSREAVLQALQVYQNEDGGYGHGLEPDHWNPNSTPIAVWEACRILRELECLHSTNPQVQGILRYLASGKEFSEGKWFNQVPSTVSYPHAIWWESPVGVPADNPTVSLAGTILRTGETTLYQKAQAIAETAVASFLNEPTSEMHTLVVYLELLQDCEEIQYQPVLANECFREILFQQIRHTVSNEPEEWFTSYVSKPSNFFFTREQLLGIFSEELCKKEAQKILEHQQADGSFVFHGNGERITQSFSLVNSGGNQLLSLKFFVFAGFSRRTFLKSAIF